MGGAALNKEAIILLARQQMGIATLLASHTCALVMLCSVKKTV
jgi:hypothetical protein